jgi:uncharacterized protein YjgD (DUF1641 family)
MKYEYKIEFESHNDNIIEIIHKINDILSSKLINQITNIKQTFTILDDIKENK